MKERLDVILVKKGFFESRERAKRAVMSGIVYVDDQKEEKAGSRFDESCHFEVRGKDLPYVSRGGLKLEKGLSFFNVDVKGSVCMDIGASTGGFTDCLLMNGAENVYSIDVGYGQLAWKLRSDSRVINIERTNFRYIDKSLIKHDIDIAVTDVSFISLTKIIPKAMDFLKPGGIFIGLIKPQFEAGREKVGKKGVVKDRNVHIEVIRKILAFSNSTGLYIKGLTYSPVKGPEGNIEFLFISEKKDMKNSDDEIDLMIKSLFESMNDI
jgi:23S rRNA (cytidine1920-2'-O)/16S rRNA (cytidine1409-2'-O)-methyltransferase